MTVFLFILGYFAVGFIFFFLTLLAEKIFNFGLFTAIERGKEVKSASLGVFIIIMWFLIMPILILLGFGAFLHWFCGLFVKEEVQA